MSSSPPPESLFDPRFVRVMEQLTLAGRRVPTGMSAGQWRSRTTGSSVEFADYRTYAPGDDYRRIDWNAYARLERLFMRLYRAEENLSLSVLIDTSLSMSWGRPSKARLASQLAGALAFIAVRTDERVNVAACRGGGVAERAPTAFGQSGALSVWRFLERLTFAGQTNLATSLGTYARYVHGSGLCVVLTDMFSPAGYQQGIDALLSRRQDVVLVHVMAPDEVAPPPELIGEWRLQDVENADPVVATITPQVLRTYRRLVAQYSEEISDFCRRRGVTYLFLRSDAAIEEVLLRTFRRAGVLV